MWVGVLVSFGFIMLITSFIFLIFIGGVCYCFFLSFDCPRKLVSHLTNHQFSNTPYLMTSPELRHHSRLHFDLPAAILTAATVTTAMTTMATGYTEKSESMEVAWTRTSPNHSSIQTLSNMAAQCHPCPNQVTGTSGAQCFKSRF